MDYLSLLLHLGATGATIAGVIWAVRAALGHRHRERLEMLRIQAERDVRIAQAKHAHPLPPQNFAPHSTYSPHTSGGTSTPAAPPDDQAQDTKPAAVPTFAGLLSSGMIGTGQPLILGYDQMGSPVYGSWLDLYSTGIGGVSGSGKSWTGAYLLAQSVLNGANIAILDPHAGDSESLSTRLEPLSGRFLCEVADTPRSMLDIVKLVQSELNARKEQRSRRAPWIIVADEFSSLMRGELADPLALLFEEISQEGRKLAVFGCALGQVWQTSRSGGGELRDALASQYIHRLRPNQARYLTGLTAADLPRDLLELPAGTGYLLSTRGELQRVTIPQCSSRDMVTVAGLLPDTIHSQADVIEPATPRQTTGNGSAKGYTAEERRILDLFASGASMADIAREISGAKNGRAYSAASERAQAVIREAMQQARVVGE